jgi:hypothetical protein
MPTLRTSLRALAAGALILTSCKQVTSVKLTAYALTSIAGLSLPTAYAPNPDFNARMMSAIMILREGGRGEWFGRSEQSVNGPLFDWVQDFSWTQTGFTLSITLDCDDTAACVAGPHMTGLVQIGRITFETSNVMRVPLVFETSAAPQG